MQIATALNNPPGSRATAMLARGPSNVLLQEQHASLGLVCQLSQKQWSCASAPGMKAMITTPESNDED
jgi:hypothetical protein